jgi:hypothetical protein
MAEADSFKFNFGRAGDESEDVAVNVSMDGSGGRRKRDATVGWR